ncbi:hypothetical protein NECAME_03789 [Necator americanus]|uniref:Uncharacterized protein n=1 Tax=Necator americanus TaxID=51031 RepID=W2T356_NECAM|nr:hypothetical protein NECAME_03789 [Necator americanus]ETN75407.1 hypothetical protein NECAME_03789 [Necator americanus]
MGSIFRYTREIGTLVVCIFYYLILEKDRFPRFCTLENLHNYPNASDFVLIFFVQTLL